MNSHPTSNTSLSLHRVCAAIFSWILVGFVFGCASSDKEDSYSAPEEVSLKADRAELEALRKEIPETKQTENDELALILKDMGTVKEHPDKVRDRFQKEMRKKRDVFYKQVRKTRDAYNKKERKTREEFLRTQRKDREAFLKKKATPEDRREYMADNQSKQADYFATQRENRQEFESTVKEKTSDFESYLKDRTSEFNFELKAYRERHDQRLKDIKNKTGILIPTTDSTASGPPPTLPPMMQDDLKDFQNIPTGNAKPLGADDGP